MGDWLLGKSKGLFAGYDYNHQLSNHVPAKQANPSNEAEKRKKLGLDERLLHSGLSSTYSNA